MMQAAAVRKLATLQAKAVMQQNFERGRQMAMVMHTLMSSQRMTTQVRPFV